MYELTLPLKGQFRQSSMLLVLILILAMASACGEADSSEVGSSTDGGLGAEPTPTYDPRELTETPVPLDKVEEPQPPRSDPAPSDPIGIGITGEYAPPLTPEEMVAENGLFISGKVVEVLPAQWNTPDGRRPENPWETALAPHLIFTPAIIELDGPPIVDRYGVGSPAQLVVATIGGKVGEDVVEFNNAMQFGEHVLLGLADYTAIKADRKERFETPAGLSWNVLLKFVLTDDGMADPAHPNAEPLPAEQLIEELRAASANR